MNIVYVIVDSYIVWKSWSMTWDAEWWLVLLTVLNWFWLIILAKNNHGLSINKRFMEAKINLVTFVIGLYENIIHWPAFSLAKGGMDSWLLPLQLPLPTENCEDFINLHRKMLNDYYMDAVKYFQLALYSAPPFLVALLPLIQVCKIVCIYIHICCK